MTPQDSSKDQYSKQKLCHCYQEANNHRIDPRFIVELFPGRVMSFKFLEYERRYSGSRYHDQPYQSHDNKEDLELLYVEELQEIELIDSY